MEYTCTLSKGHNTCSWRCVISLICNHDPYFEANIQGNGSSFHVITGPHIGGNFLCIPDHEIGCELATLTDVFWNTEQIRHHLNPKDSRTLAVGLSLIPAMINR